MSGKLILLGTPIGNLDDISFRAVKCLQECDFIAAEDTRVTVKLLNHFNIKKPLTSYYEHNASFKDNKILQRIISGENCVLVSDAGMPAISDPGQSIVELCHKNNIQVTVIPGACAAISALTVSGLDTKSFVFEGFLSTTKNKRVKKLKFLADEPRTVILYEAPHKLIKTLSDLYSYLGNRRLTLVRELTKIHEEIITTDLNGALELYSENNKPRGEFVLIIEGKTLSEENIYTLEQAVKLAKEFIRDGSSTTSASKRASDITKLKKRDIYNMLVKSTKDVL